MKINIIEGPGGAAGTVGLRIRELRDVQRMQTIDIFLLCDTVQDRSLVNMSWEW